MDSQPNLFAPPPEIVELASIRFWPPHGTKIQRDDGSIAMIDWTLELDSKAALDELRQHVKSGPTCPRCGEPVPLIPISLVNIRRTSKY